MSKDHSEKSAKDETAAQSKEDRLAAVQKKIEELVAERERIQLED